MALVGIGLLALVLFIYFKVNDTFGLYLALLLCAVGLVGGLVWVVVKVGKILKA